MKTKNFLSMMSLALMFSLSAFLVSCDDENRLTGQDAQDIAEDAITDAYFEDADDLGTVSMSAATENELGGASAAARVAETIVITVNDSRKCVGSNGFTATIVRDAASTFENPIGTITIDFGAGCTDIRGNVRSGKLIFAYNGRRFQPGSTLVLTTDNYFINGVQLEGTRTLTNITESSDSAPKFEIELVNGKATFPDGSIATREASFTRSWLKGVVDDITDDQLQINGNASGVTRGGRSYTMQILETLVFKRNCGGLPVDGVKRFTTEGKEITVDYGNGECDRIVTYTVGDRTVTTTVGKN